MLGGLVALYALISTFFTPSYVLQDRANHPLIKEKTEKVVIRENSRTEIETPKNSNYQIIYK